MSTANRMFPLVIVASFFLLFGFMTTLNDSVIPFLQDSMSLSYTQVMLIQMSFFSGYFIAPLLCVYCMNRFGHRLTIFASMLVCALASFLLALSALEQWYEAILFAFYLLGSAIAFLQVAGNAYAVLAGDERTSSSRLTLIHGFNSIGTVISPLVGSAVFLSATALSQQHAGVVLKTPYMVFGGLWLLLALGAFLVSMPLTQKAKYDKVMGQLSVSKLFQPALVLGFLGIFFYVGGEVSIGSFLVKFLQDPKTGALSAQAAGHCLMFYWGGQMLGRFIGAAYLRRYLPTSVLFLHAMVAAMLVVLAASFSGSFVMVAILAVGLCNSIMFPTIFSQTMLAVGADNSHAAGIMTIGCVGGALMPMLQAYVADNIGLQISFLVPACCYVYIAYFAKAIEGIKARRVYSPTSFVSSTNA